MVRSCIWLFLKISCVVLQLSPSNFLTAPSFFFYPNIVCFVCSPVNFCVDIYILLSSFMFQPSDSYNHTYCDFMNLWIVVHFKFPGLKAEKCIAASGANYQTTPGKFLLLLPIMHKLIFSLL